MEQYLCTAGKYSRSGTLVLCCLEDSYTSLVIYDACNFRRIKNIPLAYLKMSVMRVQWVNNNQQLLLYSNANN
jgi:hypothetical protein